MKQKEILKKGLAAALSVAMALSLAPYGGFVPSASRVVAAPASFLTSGKVTGATSTATVDEPNAKGSYFDGSTGTIYLPATDNEGAGAGVTISLTLDSSVTGFDDENILVKKNGGATDDKLIANANYENKKLVLKSNEATPGSKYTVSLPLKVSVSGKDSAYIKLPL